MTAAVAIQHAQKTTINTLARLETLVSKLYSRFAVILPDHADMWNSIAEEEVVHAKLLMSMHRFLDRGDVFYNIGRFDGAMIASISSLLENMTAITHEKEISHLEALTASLQVEALAVESDFYKIVTSSAPEFRIIANRLIEETHHHQIQMNRAWQDEVLVHPSPAKHTTPHSPFSISIRYNEENGCVMGKFTGKMDILAAKQYVKQVVHVGDEYYCKRFINDLRDAQTDFSDPVLTDLLGLFDATGLDRSWIRAVLVHEQNSAYKKVEQLAKQSGYTVKLFDDESVACQWAVKMH